MKKKILFTILLFGALFPFQVDALSGNINVSCDKTTLSPQESTTCHVTGTANEEVSTVSAKVKVGDQLTLVSVKTDSIWQGDGDGGQIELYTDTNKSGTFAIATFTIKAKSTAGDTNVMIDSVYFSDAAFEQFAISSVTRNIHISTPVVEIPDEEPEAGHDNTPSTSTPDTNYGQNVDHKSSDATLKSLTVDVDGFVFDKNKVEYQLEVDNSIDVIHISAEATDDQAVVTLPDHLNLNVGNNVFEIKVTAEDGTILTYRINVNRLENVLSNNAYLSKLVIADHEIDFHKETTYYVLEKVTTSSLDLQIETENENATYQVYGNQNLTDQDAIVIRVTAEDGTNQEYIIYVNEVSKTPNIPISSILCVCFLILSISLNVFQFWKHKTSHK